ncbi:hypothetical protein MNBD_PLANCTO02-894 [hydrothermal vent metagenome]|uniref:VWFA domain-containing protein n=1 Tax=hydrothermal vent metagenome TaxID=652676 RepID=A0A3B1D5Y2_9ZZZZ
MALHEGTTTKGSRKTRGTSIGSGRCVQSRSRNTLRQSSSSPRSLFKKTSLLVWGLSFGVHGVVLVVLSFFSLTLPPHQEDRLLISSWRDTSISKDLELISRIPSEFDLPKPDSSNSGEMPPIVDISSHALLVEPTPQKINFSSKSKPKPPSDKDDSPPLPSRKPDKPKYSTKFFGKEVSGKTIVFVLDISSSMKGRRHRRAIQELKQAIQKLKPEQEFSVVLYHEEVLQFTLLEKNTGLIEVSPDSKRRAIRWAKKQKPIGLTDPAPALERALSWKPEVIVLFSDGELPSTILQIAKEYNHSHTVIHTLSFSSPTENTAMKVLQMLASQNHGQFHLISR